MMILSAAPNRSKSLTISSVLIYNGIVVLLLSHMYLMYLNPFNQVYDKPQLSRNVLIPTVYKKGSSFSRAGAFLGNKEDISNVQILRALRA